MFERVRDTFYKKSSTCRYYVESIIGLPSYNLSILVVESGVMTSLIINLKCTSFEIKKSKRYEHCFHS